MQDDFTHEDVAPRRRRWPYVLAALAVVVAAAWSALWYFAAGRAEEVIAGWRAREARAGRIHTCGSQTVGGFPLRFEMRCTDPGLELKSAQPLSIKGKDVRVTANVWQPTRLTAEITGPLTVAEPGQPPTVTANWSHAQSELRGLPTAPEQVVLTFDRPLVERTTDGAVLRLFTAERLEITGHRGRPQHDRGRCADAASADTGAARRQHHRGAARPEELRAEAVGGSLPRDPGSRRTH
jgi:hypothetical protein